MLTAIAVEAAPVFGWAATRPLRAHRYSQQIEPAEPTSSATTVAAEDAHWRCSTSLPTARWPGWPASGVLLRTQPAEVTGLQLHVGPSGVWAVWSQAAMLPNSNIIRRPYVTQLLADGTPVAGFTLAGSPDASGLEGEAVVTDSGLGASGDLMTRIEYTQHWPAPSASGTDLLAQRVLVGGGQPAGWPANDRVVCDAPGEQVEGRMFRQGDGAFFAWKDKRADGSDIYALRLLADGTLPTEWSVNGLLVCGVAGMQYAPVIGYNTVGGGFVAWLDQRDFATHCNALCAQTVSGDARLSTEPNIPLSFALSAARRGSSAVREWW